MYSEGVNDKNQFIQGNQLNMEKILEKFIRHFNDIYGSQPDKFKEEDGRKLFLLYLRPIINGTGNYYIEAQTRDQKRTDVIVDYLGKQYIVELKSGVARNTTPKEKNRLLSIWITITLIKGIC